MSKYLLCNGLGRQAAVALAMVVLLVVSVSAQDVIFPVDAEWSFLSPDGAADDPGDFDASFDSTWFTSGYDDSAWDGPATGPFEYGGVNSFNNSPTVNFLLEASSGDRYTNYFRREFTTTQAFSNVGADLLADDGAVIYLDGQEITRFNCCATAEDDYLSFASATGNEDSFARVRIVDELPAGDHLLAVSVHQVNETSSDLGFGFSLVTLPPPDPNAVITGVDTLIAESAQSGPDSPHGALGEWEFDGEDGGGENHGLLWFDIPQEKLASFGNGTASLKLMGTNEGTPGEVHRMISDWLSGANGGDNVTWNNIPGGPGVVPGENAEADPSFNTGPVLAGDLLEFDVSADVQAWAAGAPNYGWGFIPTGNNGVGIASFEGAEGPQLILEPGEVLGPPLQAGDADQDLDFDQLDLVKVQIANKYLTGQAANWGEGDWNGAPGGSPGNPPAGDGFFNQLDIIAASLGGTYLTGPYAAVSPGGQEGDGQTSIIYNAGTGEVAVDAPAGTDLTSINIDSASGIFTGDAAVNLGGSFDNDADNNIFKATFGSSFGSLSFGNVAQAGLSEEFVLNDLSVVGSLAGGGDLGDVDLVYVPEPSTVLLLALGLFAVAGSRFRKRS